MSAKSWLKRSTRSRCERKFAVRRRRDRGRLAETFGAGGADEALDARLAEEIDGLAWIADEEDGLGVAVPGFGEQLDEVVLAGGGVLHLVDEQMLEACAELRRRGLGAGFLAEGVAGEQAEFGEVALVALGEDELEFDQGAAEDAEEGFGDGPLIGRVVGGREATHGAEDGE
jgi:hypothetical protein